MQHVRRAPYLQHGEIETLQQTCGCALNGIAPRVAHLGVKVRGRLFQIARWLRFPARDCAVPPELPHLERCRMPAAAVSTHIKPPALRVPTAQDPPPPDCRAARSHPAPPARSR